MYFPAATSRWLHALAVVTCAAVAVGVVLRLVLRSLSGDPVIAYTLSLYWWHYDYGLTRRALPGELLELVGGATPATATALALLLSAAAALACVVLAVALARTWERRDRWIPLVLLVAGPFTVSLVALDLGRYDAVGFAAMTGVALLAQATRRPWARTALASALVVVAVASEEFLLGFLLVPVVVLVARAHLSGRARVRGALLALGPGAVLTGLLLLRQPAPADTRAAYDLAAQVLVIDRQSALETLSLTLDEQLGLFAWYSPGYVVLSCLVWAAGYALFAHLLLRRVATPSRALLVLLVLWPAAVALALGLVGVDYRRWWALALVSLVASVVALAERGRQPALRHRRPRLDAALLVVALLCCVLLQDDPVYPTTFGLDGLLGAT